VIAQLFDHLWQSTLFLAAATGVTLLVRRNRAALRHGIWLAASIKFLVPFALLSSLGGLVADLAKTAPLPVAESLAPLAAPFSGPMPAVALSFLDADLQPLSAASPLSYLLVLWAVGFGSVGALWLSRSFELAGLARRSRLLKTSQAVFVKSSPRQIEPALVGLMHPVILLPEGIEEQLAPRELELIIQHELCHLRRYDNLTAAWHMLVTAICWFYPPVWWLGTRLLAEREAACDEAVVAESGDPRAYADAILKVCKFYLHSPLPCISGVAGGALKLRLESIMNESAVRPLNTPQKLFLATMAILPVAAPIAAGGTARAPVWGGAVLPAGWKTIGGGNSDYAVGTLPANGAEPVMFAYARPGAAKTGFAGADQCVGAGAYLGMRLRLSAWLKTDKAGAAQLWMRVDGPAEDDIGLPRTMSFYNMADRPVRGTSQRARHDIVLDVPAQSERICYGFFLGGGVGKAWADSFRMTVVGSGVPLSRMPRNPG
jgi:beta-lactamase regulating signal transducer with metallopeptidase domain